MNVTDEMLDERQRHRLIADVGIGAAVEDDEGTLECLHRVAVNVIVAAGHEVGHGVAVVDGNVDVVPRLETAVVGERGVVADVVHPARECDEVVGMGRARDLGGELIDGLLRLRIQMRVGDGGDDLVPAGIPRAERRGGKHEQRAKKTHLSFMPKWWENTRWDLWDQ